MLGSPPQNGVTYRLVDVLRTHNALETKHFIHLPWLAMFFTRASIIFFHEWLLRLMCTRVDIDIFQSFGWDAIIGSHSILLSKCTVVTTLSRYAWDISHASYNIARIIVVVLKPLFIHHQQWVQTWYSRQRYGVNVLFHFRSVLWSDSTCTCQGAAKMIRTKIDTSCGYFAFKMVPKHNPSCEMPNLGRIFLLTSQPFLECCAFSFQ